MIYDILPVNNYQGNNCCTTFDFNFYIENESQLNVYHYDKDKIKTLLKYDIDYSINEFKNKNGSYITFPLENSIYPILNSEEYISLELTLPIAQETQYNNSSLLNLEALEYSLDYLTRLIQIYSRKFELCVKVDECAQVLPSNLIEEINNKAIVVRNALENVNVLNSEIIETKNHIDNLNVQIDEKHTSINEINNSLTSSVEKINEIDTIQTKINTIQTNIASLPTSINIDGNWKSIEKRLISDITIGAAKYEVDVSSKIPKDGYDYEVIVNFNGKPAAQGGIVQVIGDYSSIVIGRAMTSGGIINAVTGVIILGQNRIVKLTTTSDTSCWNYCNFNVYSCRKLGKAM